MRRAVCIHSFLPETALVVQLNHRQPADAPDLHPDAIYSLTLTGARHCGSANVVFGDAHVEYARTNSLTATNARQHWNFDHQPHSDAVLYFP